MPMRMPVPSRPVGPDSIRGHIGQMIGWRPSFLNGRNHPAIADSRLTSVDQNGTLTCTYTALLSVSSIGGRMKRHGPFMMTVLAGWLLSGCAATGCKVGLNVAELETDYATVAEDARIGPIAGIFGTVPLRNDLAMSLELLVSVQGATGPYSYEAELVYIEVPVLLRTSVSGSAFYVGAAPAYFVRGEEKSDLFFNELSSWVEEFDLGIVVGYEHRAGQLLVDLRYCWGVTDIVKDDDRAATNRALSVMVGRVF